jgi:hypothetical protein
MMDCGTSGVSGMVVDGGGATFISTPTWEWLCDVVLGGERRRHYSYAPPVHSAPVG